MREPPISPATTTPTITANRFTRKLPPGSPVAAALDLKLGCRATLIAPVARRGLDARVAPLGTPAHGRHPLRVQLVGDRLQRHPLSAHVSDSLAEVRIVRDRGTPGRPAVHTCGSETIACPLTDPGPFPFRHLDKQSASQTTLLGGAVEGVGRGDQACLEATKQLHYGAELAD